MKMKRDHHRSKINTTTNDNNDITVDFDLQYKKAWKKSLVKALYCSAFIYCICTTFASSYSLYKEEMEFTITVICLLIIGIFVPTCLLCMMGRSKNNERFILLLPLSKKKSNNNNNNDNIEDKKKKKKNNNNNPYTGFREV